MQKKPLLLKLENIVNSVECDSSCSLVLDERAMTDVLYKKHLRKEISSDLTEKTEKIEVVGLELHVATSRKDVNIDETRSESRR